tara:strand:- start:253 stop:516 length:264 start_codon:yes stop_codon:yes gene_type:complete
MAFVGSHFGMGLGNTLFIFFFIIIGSILGIHFKILSSTIIFLFIFIGSLFDYGNARIFAMIIFFILGLFVAKKTKNYFLNSSYSNYF